MKIADPNQLSLFDREETCQAARAGEPLVAVTAADAAQHRATDPAASVWVGASAGTGKTKVLTDRALRLMVNGTPPQRILCLTFTKAAAAEMAGRINTELGLWAKKPQAELDDRLVRLLGRAASESEVQRARSLFPAVLDAPGGLKVLTIHAFCQSLLGRFPLEAGLAPHFSVMDERDTAEALAAVCEDLLVRAQNSEGPLADALATVTAHLQENAFRALMQALTFHRDRLNRAIRHHGSATAAATALRRHLDVGEDETVARVRTNACGERAFEGAALRVAAEALLSGTKTDTNRGKIIANWLASDTASRVETLDSYRRAFLTDKNKVLATLMTKDCAKTAPSAAEALGAEAERISAVLARCRAVGCADTSAAVLTLAEALLDAYDTYKQARAGLDYDDLIERAAELLEKDGGAAWVLFKLDGGIDHVLVDEAQDTSSAQWRVIRALTAEFFAGAGRGDATRTVFAVGDVKQSIFSFQGADPALFLDNGRHFGESVAKAGHGWHPVKMFVSFRSTRAVLAAVDAVFALDENRDGVALDGATIEHAVSEKRAGDGGSVELWPPIPARKDDVSPPWRPPVEQTQSDSPKRRLARVVARRIRAMLDGKTLLASQGRPIRPEDILVLVRRRDDFVAELVRVLKGLYVPVAGVDRMELSKQIAVMDLVALGRFVLLPEDDLTLACVLKSPLVGFDDDDLFALAHDRPGSLWRALRHRRAEHPRYGDAVDLLVELLSAADAMPPYEFYMRTLGPLDGRRRLLTRLGHDADDPIAEFLDLALAYERRHPPSLEGFLHWLETGDSTVKRDLEQAAAAVRIMTVHGAKGLQAPIVFLPDTMETPRSGGAKNNTGQLVWPVLTDGVAVPLWAPRADACDKIAQDERDRLKAEEMREYRRLLYVAMTRAADRLIVCGWHRKNRKNAEPQGCWYGAIRRGLESAGGAETVQDAGLAGDCDFDAEPSVLRLSCPQERQLKENEPEPTRTAFSLPYWADQPAPADAAAEPPLIPSRAGDAFVPTRSPTSAESNGLKRGRLIHRLLQRLPDLEPDLRPAAAAAWLAQPAHGLDSEAQAVMLSEVLAVLNHPDHTALFEPDSLAEVPISGMVGGRMISAQVDRLLVGADRVTIVDYKTDRPAPATADQVGAPYLTQMAAYRAALRLVYPRHAVRCALLWTAAPAFMILPDSALDRHAP